MTSDPGCCFLFVDASSSEAPNALAATLTTLSIALTTIEVAEAVVMDGLAAMQLRMRKAVASTRDASEAIVAAVTRSQAAVLSRARSRYRMLANKQLTEYREEADANACGVGCGGINA